MVEENLPQSSTETSQENDRVNSKNIEDEMKKSYLTYSMSVIIGRALPDVRDGLKPVHRRVLYSMWDNNWKNSSKTVKSAKIVGAVIANLHPHGDIAVYDSLVRMTQDFSLRYPLVHGQGNFGSIDGDSQAAYRYTEAKLSKISEELLIDIEKETVDFVLNFDGTMKEPTVLPSKFPNLLVNGSSGIAVGMATNMPPHNLREVCDSVLKFIDNQEVSVDELIAFLPGPDFPTGGIICGSTGIKEAYKTGKGKIIVRAKASIEESKNKTKIIITEIPYMVNKSQLVEQIADNIRDKKIIGISDLRDESDRDGLRIVIELKTGANHEIVLNQLYSFTRLQETFGIIMLALDENQPKILNLKELIQKYVQHRQIVVRKRTQFDCNEAEQKVHILEGLIIALDRIDDVVKFIKSCKNVEDARNGLMADYSLSEKQSQAILEMRLQKLTSLEVEKIKNDHGELIELINKLKEILSSEQKILEIIKEEITKIKGSFGDSRRTQIIETENAHFEEESLVKSEEMAVTMSNAGYIKRLTVETYKQQKRGGKGVIGALTKEEDFVKKLFVANTHDYLLFFTNRGRVHWLKVFQLPEAGRYAKGSAIVNLLSLEKDEKVTALLPVKEFPKEKYLFMTTKQGLVKKTSMEEFSNPRKGGITAITLDEGDELINVLITKGKDQILLGTSNGLAVRFDENDVRQTGRTSKGVIGIRLKDNDFVVDSTIAQDGKHLLTLTELGHGKRTEVSDYRQINRGGVGVINIKITEKNGKVVALMQVDENDEFIIMTKNGIILRTPVRGVSVIGRNTQGVRVIKLDDTDLVTGAAIVVEK